MTVRKFRKQPVIIEAMQYNTVNDYLEIVAWMQASGNREALNSRIRVGAEGITIPTLEGDMTASPGDWVIKGLAGEFYPCKKDIFQRSYEAEETR